MMRSIRQPALRIACAALVLVSSTAYADDPPPVGWYGRGETGLVLARGNADTTTADVKLDASDIIDAWKHTAHLAFSRIRLRGSRAVYGGEQLEILRILLAPRLPLLGPRVLKAAFQ